MSIRSENRDQIQALQKRALMSMANARNEDIRFAARRLLEVVRKAHREGLSIEILDKLEEALNDLTEEEEAFRKNKEAARNQLMRQYLSSSGSHSHQIQIPEGGISWSSVDNTPFIVTPPQPKPDKVGRNPLDPARWGAWVYALVSAVKSRKSLTS